MKHPGLFSDFELPIAVRPHKQLNYLENECMRRAAELSDIKREHIAYGSWLLCNLSVPYNEVVRLWSRQEELSQRIEALESEILDELRRIEHDRLEYVDRMLVKIEAEQGALL